MGVKNNFSQAVSELIGISRNVEPDNKKEISEEITDEVLETEAIAEDVTEEEGALQDMEDIERETELTEEQKEEAPQTSQNPKERIMAMLAAQQASQQQPQEQPQAPQPQAPQPQEQSFQQAAPRPRPAGDGGVTTIAKGTVIIGEINADGDVELLGSVKGKIASQGDIKANGKVIGDLIGRDIELISCAVQGNIIASGMVTVDGDSVVVGDVKGENFCLDGKIKGNVSVEKEAKFQPKAILAGNVTTASIAMSQGAKIQGEVNIPLNEKETDMSFDIDMMI
jgi:cytoskeletal protein CcmA (bactofilin family)